jgi:hypothetical protein
MKKKNLKQTLLDVEQTFLNLKRILLKNTILGVKQGNGELLELRLLETGFLSRFQLNP